MYKKYYVVYVSWGTRIYREGYDIEEIVKDLQYSGYSGWEIDKFNSKQDVKYR